MKFKSLILLVVSLFILFSCDDGIKFDNPLDERNRTSDSNDTEAETESDSDKTDTASTNDEENQNRDDSDSGDTRPDDADSTDDSGDSLPDKNNPDDDSADSVSDDDSDSVQENDDDTDTPTDPCDPNPCTGISNSTGVCTATGTENYFCGCASGYHWWGKETGCTNKLTLGNICTGQNKCYSNTEEISCPTSSSEDFFGQDAQYTGKCVAQSFTVGTGAQTGTLIDNNTGLIWEQSPSENKYTWDNRATHCNELNSSNFGGKSNWRVPNPLEFLTIVDNSTSSPATNSNFTNMPTNGLVFWTSKEFRENTSHAVAFSMYYGDLTQFTKTNTLKVLCVSGEEMQPATSVDFTTQTISGKVVVTDDKTGLMWQKEYEKSKTWQQALKYCEDSTYAGYSDWRLPNKNELASLLDSGKSGAPYSKFPDMPSAVFCSATTPSCFTEDAWYVSFGSASVNSGVSKLSHYYNVRCVRNNDGSTPTTTEEECTAAGGNWNGLRCTRTQNCSAKPANSDWNGNSSYTQKYVGGEWMPSVNTVYSENAEECHFKCVTDYFWNGSACVVSPCSSNPCNSVENSTEICTATSATNYSCSCEENYYWWGIGKGCQNSRPALGNICTGQNKCYNNTEKITCPAEGEDFFGQDAYYASLGKCIPQSFAVQTISNQKVVIDNSTGLMWQQTIPTDEYKWDDAISYCNNSGYAGYNDWRLPTPQELLTIVDNSKAYNNYDARVNTAYFPYITANQFWSSSIYIQDTSYAWDIAFHLGSATYDMTTSQYKYVCCVRGESFPNSSFESSTVNGNVIVTDTKTGLVWQKTYETGKTTWQEALDYCEDLTYGGYNDWRLPDKNELVSLVNYAKYDPASDFPDMPSRDFWSSSTEISNFAWTVSFYSGYVSSCIKSSTSTPNQRMVVRCVRSEW